MFWRFEQPQTIAFVLANVDADKGSEVLQMMPPNIQEQVIERGWCYGNHTHGSNRGGS